MEASGNRRIRGPVADRDAAAAGPPANSFNGGGLQSDQGVRRNANLAGRRHLLIVAVEVFVGIEIWVVGVDVSAESVGPMRFPAATLAAAPGLRSPSPIPFFGLHFVRDQHMLPSITSANSFTLRHKKPSKNSYPMAGTPV